MAGNRRIFAKMIFAAVMMLCGMLFAYEPIAKDADEPIQGTRVLEEQVQKTEHAQQNVHVQETAHVQQTVQASAQPADERKEEKNSTTSQLYAQSAVLMDAESGRILLGKNEEDILPMASTTKIMTCILVLEEGNAEDIIPVSSYAAGQPKVHLGAKKGEYYKTKDLLYSLMLESHNDAAVILAEYYGSKWADITTDCVSHSQQESQNAVIAFASKMNEKARELGCKNTFFVTPNGLDGMLTVEENGEKIEKQHTTTAADLALIMKYCAWDSPAASSFLKITQTSAYSFQNYVKTDGGTAFKTGSRTVSCNNHNAFLQMMDGALSGKTGFTGKAGYCYVGALEKDDKKFTIALLACGWPNNKTWKWHDSRLLFEFGLDNYEWRDIYIEEKPENLFIKDGQEQEAALKIDKEEIRVLLEAHDEVEVITEIPEILAAPVEKGMVIGEQKYYVNGELVRSLPVVTVNEVLKIDYCFCLKKIVKMALL